ncbi:MAG: hypothetical protein CL583_01260 [Alteromonadaceae bacterium]|nr:hypothetical protein [Alteromonadaceae bacterium]|tara:strand:- start:3581 stop:4525 length:945 start_codon:yes stop_codon:yes gene_type:complete
MSDKNKSYADGSKPGPITMGYKKRERISVDECMGMYDLFATYYRNAPLETFLKDLSNKTGVHIAKRKSDGKVVGFSTATRFDIEVEGRKVKMLFSGDTVMAKEYWGNSAFPKSFARWILSERLRYPFAELHWFLISMGYRTYLTMANNFYNYYPNIDGDDPYLKKVAAAASEALFPGKLDPETMLLDFGEDACALQDFVTPITDNERLVPKIAFFESRNAEWMNGKEMACIGSLDHMSFVKLLILDARKTLFKKGARKGMKQQSSAEAPSAAAGKAVVQQVVAKQAGTRQAATKQAAPEKTAKKQAVTGRIAAE